MKKFPLLFLVLYWPICLFSQHALKAELNMPRTGDEIVKQQVSYKDPGRSGENVLWDFSQLQLENETYFQTYSLNEDSLIVGTEHRTRYYYGLSNDSLSCLGYENQTTLMKNSQTELLLRFPVHYRDSTTSYFYGKGKYCDRLAISAMGMTQIHADAYGMMILPNEDTLRHVVRVKTKKLIAEDTRPLEKEEETAFLIPVTNDSIDYRLANDTILLEVDTYRWYANGYRYPVFETIKSVTYKKGHEKKYFDVAFFYPPQEQFYLAEDEENQRILEELSATDDSAGNGPWFNLSYNFYPNPVVDKLEVEMYLPHSTSIRTQLSDRSGKVIAEDNWGVYLEGVLGKQIYMSHIPSGEYVLNVWLGDSCMVSYMLFKR